MKRKLMLGLAVMLVTGMLAGCGSDKEQNQGNGEKSDRFNLSEMKVEDYVTLGEYKNLAVTVNAKEEVTDDLVDSEALMFYQSYVTKDNGGVVNRAVAEGDTVIIDYMGKKDGVAFEGGTSEGASLTIGSNSFIDGFEDGLIGVMPGKTVDLNLTFPENYGNEELNGAKVVFTVTVHYILPVEMQDKVVAGFGSEDYKNVKEMKQYCRKALEDQAQRIYDQDVEIALFSKLIDNNTYKELPKEFTEPFEKQLRSNLDQQAAMYGIDSVTLVYYLYDIDYATFLDHNVDYASKVNLTAWAIAEKEGLLPTEKELDKRIEKIAEDNGWKSVEDLLAAYDREELRESIVCDDVVDFLLKTAKVTEQ